MTPDIEDSEHARDRLTRTLRSRAARKRTQQLVGLLLLLFGYICLAVPAETASEWLLLRVVGGFVLLFVGFSVAIGPTVTALLGHHD